MQNLKYLLFTIFSFIAFDASAQVIGTLINVGKYNLHFTIIPGKGTPILFESGGGNAGTIWNNITKPCAVALVITLSRRRTDFTLLQKYLVSCEQYSCWTMPLGFVYLLDATQNLKITSYLRLCLS